MYMFNGTGTTLYGKRDVAPDGSYIATKWLVFVFLPVLPLGSFRVWRGEWHWRLLGSSTDYHMVRVPLNRRQVFNCYLVSLFLGPFIGALLAVSLLLMGWGLVESWLHR